MTLTKNKWENITEQIAAAFRFDDREKNSFRKNDVAKLIAAIPYNAECEDMERTALAHLGTYLLAANDSCRTVFNHRADDDSDMFKRMRQLSYCRGGDKEVIERGLNLLALIQLEDHRHDLEEDISTGKYNPVAAGSWDYEAERAVLVKRIESVPNPEMDEVITIDGIRGYWNDL